MNIEHALHGWLGQWEVIVQDKNSNIIERTGIRPNLIMDDGLNMFRDLLSGTITNGEIKYVALGNGTTSAEKDQHTLVSEQFRNQVSSQYNDNSTPGKLVTEFYIFDLEANNFRTEEIGWFAGSGATAAANSGIMVARVLFSKQKNDRESWIIRRVDTVGRA